MKHYAVTLALLAMGAGLHVAIAAAQKRSIAYNTVTVELDIPEHVGRFAMVSDEVVDDKLKSYLETSTILIRNYEAPGGWPVQLTIVYAGTTRRSLHFPEVCLVGDGWEIEEQYTAPVGFYFVGRRLVLRKGDQRQAVLYWFKTGDTLTGNYFVNAFHWAVNQMRMSTQTSAMIKLSTIVGGNPDSSFALLDDFGVSFTPILLDRVQ